MIDLSKNQLDRNWLETFYEKKLKELSTSEKFVSRMQTLTIIQHLCKDEAVSGRYLNLTVFAVIETLAKDPVPNIKFTVAKILEAMKEKLLPGNIVKAKDLLQF